jgi:long-chain fatty acid transport protein
VLLSAGLFAQDWNITGAGARAAGIGGAFIGIADDATAIGWNPGGLTQLYRPEISLVTRFVNESFDDEFNDEKLTQNHFALNFGSAAYPFMDGKVVVALAYQQQLDMYKDWGERDTDKGGAFTISPGAAYQITPMISVGLAANFWVGNWERESAANTSDIKFSGFNMNLGTMLNMRNLSNPIPLQLGFTMRTPFELTVDVDNDVNGSWTNKVEMPLMMGLGGAFFLGENLILSADYEMRFYGASEIIYENGNPASLSDSEEDLMQFRFGAEYMLVTDFAAIPVRAGFKTVPTLLANFDEFGDADGQVIGSGFAFGTGLIFEKIAVDMTYDFETYSQDYFDTGGSDYSDTTIKGNLGISGTFYF